MVYKDDVVAASADLSKIPLYFRAFLRSEGKKQRVFLAFHAPAAALVSKLLL